MEYNAAGSFVAGVALCAFAFFLYKKYKASKNKVRGGGDKPGDPNGPVQNQN